MHERTHAISFVNDHPVFLIYSPFLITLLDLSLLFLVTQINQHFSFTRFGLWPLLVINNMLLLCFLYPVFPTSSLRFIRSWPRPRWRRCISSQLLLRHHLNVTWNEHVACFIGAPHFISRSHHTTHLNGLSAKHADLWRNKLNFPECCPTTTHKICLRLCPPLTWKLIRQAKLEGTKLAFHKMKHLWRPDFTRQVQLGACSRVRVVIFSPLKAFLFLTWKATWNACSFTSKLYLLGLLWFSCVSPV